MDQRAELSEFLRSRRARLKPQDVGLPAFGRHRRVPGLRREELAQLAGVSVAYYTRLEQGNGRNVSTEVLDAIARALRLTDAERDHLTHLAKPAHKKKRRAPATRPQTVRPALQHLLDAMDGVPAYLLGRRLDIVGWNRMARALLGDLAALEPHERNMAWQVFLAPNARDLYVDWEAKATEVVSVLRMYAGCSADDPQLSSLVGELSVKSADFRRLWAAHTVQDKGHGTKRLRHPLVGELTLAYETLKVPDDHDMALVTYTAEPGSPSADALRLLANWGVDEVAGAR
ncbi:XRE family transcriptional regulator [Streptomyces sp. WAC05374]|uniref:helix-turn-helix domain-containing protein n=1 Tax=Streptomyces sp. WAC05374 TaxID=2487420 RepID=UPI000F87F111|nr:helix-turn-helix transcriptional regulator [Streptomyces sp. WAC05374]RST18811.1 XRE family transcriptional regulator [Streptomyces sp. WAC05374]TDF43187.1 XRE family transcriptional regulator [Streptomyces sp. WAC05374]TDF50973.1 XRE family transcriptional regulator [Streptomyces sp. WAC05374]TDF52284.1 XRE family transcriptional regulator [Streptomyces sp. WAC05374]